MTETSKVDPDPSNFPSLVQSITKEKPSLDGAAVCEQQDNKAEFDFPDGGFRAWLMVFAAFCITASTFGVVNSYVRIFVRIR